MWMFLIIILGIITSYTDIKYRKIRNKHLGIVLILALPIYIYLILNKQLTINTTLFVNPLIGLFISVIFYLARVWAAGDAKLFFVYCCLVPVNRYPGMMLLPSIIILMNIFLAATLWVSLGSIRKMHQKKEAFFQKNQAVHLLLRFFYAFLILFSFGWIVFGFLRNFTSAGNSFFNIIILYMLYFFAMQKINTKFTRKTVFLIAVLLVIFRFYADPLARNFNDLLGYVRSMGVISFIFTLFNRIAEYVKNSETRIAFAPMMFLGVLLYFTDFLLWAIKFLNFLKGIA